ncbi:MAG: general secretion pathway protein GspK [Chthoniobacterales bacterium]|nr:general secretion pathway protein GspK [Chthoniobacterales bacterium]
MNGLRCNRRGAALLLVLWAIAVLSFSVLWVSSLVNLEMDTGSADAKGLRARQIALSGVALGSHPKVTREDTDLLERRVGPGEQMKVRIRGEGARLNINQLLADQDRVTLQKLFMLWGLDNRQADTLIDRLIDWVDDDIGRQMNGAERSEYEAVEITDAPANRPFRSVDEMGRVMGMEVLDEVHPGWRDAFTIFGDGRVDVNEASSEVLQAVTGLPPEMVEEILRMRRGADGMEPSEDDLRFEDVSQLRGWLQASIVPYEQVESKLTTESAVKRIDSRGVVGDREVLISVVAESAATGGAPTYLLWEER